MINQQLAFVFGRKRRDKYCAEKFGQSVELQGGKEDKKSPVVEI